MPQHDLKTDADVLALQPEVSKLTTFAKSLAIKSNEGYAQAGAFLMSIKGMLKKIEDARTRVTKPLLEAQRELNAQAKEAAAPLVEAELLIKRAIGVYTDEQRRQQAEAQRKADEAARKQQQLLQDRAAKAEASGKVEKAAALQVQAQTIVAPIVRVEPPKVSGIVPREVWKFEVVNAALVPREFLSVDEKKIGAVVRGLKGDASIPGVRIYSENNIAAASA